MQTFFDKLTDYVAYAHLWHSLEKTHSDKEINYLMLRMTEIEQEISQHYGLPLTLTYSEIFQELGIKDDFKMADIPVCIQQLEEASKEYLLSPAISDLNLLKMAQKYQTEIDLVLPELTLKLLAEPYYVFCYYFLFLKKTITPELFLRELRLVVKYDCSRKLTFFVEKNYEGKSEERAYLELKIIGLKFLDVFIENYKTFNDNRLDYLKNGLPF